MSITGNTYRTGKPEVPGIPLLLLANS